jgi:peptidoglycan/xylan/chitin deacetylase (PgdA/CDA1 family)
MPTPKILQTYDYSMITQSIITTDRKWYIRQGTRSDTLQIIITFLDDNNRIIDVDPQDIFVTIGEIEIKEEKIKQPDKSVRLLVSSSEILPGEYTVHANLPKRNGSIGSNAAVVYISEPLQIAWTLDWEGWDASDQTLQQISYLSGAHALPFTHFISPRTFLDGVLSEERKKQIITFLLDRYAAGDELAMHLHMHYDFVKASGITPKTSNPWGLLTKEGYDVPGTEYTAEEFRQIIQHARTIMHNNGFPEISGYRAGGWFINAEQLNVLEEEGYNYDSSGREKPATGAFRTIPWDLSIDSSPYYITNSKLLMEIPNAGGSTYELTSEEIINRINLVYDEDILINPKIFVIVSHPQFATREFSRIPEILSYLKTLSRDNDQGPAIFVTMSEIHHVWETLLP